MIRGDVQPVAKDAEILPGKKFVANVPCTASLELTKMTEPPKVILQWPTELGK